MEAFFKLFIGLGVRWFWGEAVDVWARWAGEIPLADEVAGGCRDQGAAELLHGKRFGNASGLEAIILVQVSIISRQAFII